MMEQKDIMRRVVELSRKGMREGYGGPFGCVVVRDGEIVAEAHNEVLTSNDPTAHAENSGYPPRKSEAWHVRFV